MNRSETQIDPDPEDADCIADLLGLKISIPKTTKGDLEHHVSSEILRAIGKLTGFPFEIIDIFDALVVSCGIANNHSCVGARVEASKIRIFHIDATIPSGSGCRGGLLHCRDADTDRHINLSDPDAFKKAVAEIAGRLSQERL
jgi:hypothetical protein